MALKANYRPCTIGTDNALRHYLTSTALQCWYALGTKIYLYFLRRTFGTQHYYLAYWLWFHCYWALSASMRCCSNQHLPFLIDIIGFRLATQPHSWNFFNTFSTIETDNFSTTNILFWNLEAVSNLLQRLRVLWQQCSYFGAFEQSIVWFSQYILLDWISQMSRI